jgi:hypothetical protein
MQQKISNCLTNRADLFALLCKGNAWALCQADGSVQEEQQDGLFHARTAISATMGQVKCIK